MRWFKHHASHHDPECLAFKSWVYLEARAAIKQRQNKIATQYVRILESGSIQGKTHTDGPVMTIANSYGTVVK